jgi:protein-S-isoprenylcysteine O-methyltransferase Ste14
MFGFPLTIYLLSGWLQSRFPQIDWYSHDAGHLPEMIFGWRGNPHCGPFHILSSIVIFAGFWLIYEAWKVLYVAQRDHRLAMSGPYAWVRHPQYVGFVVIMIGFLLQWPTLATLLMFPVLVWFYVRLSHREEVDSAEEFGDAWTAYAQATPAFIPQFGRHDVGVA